MDPLEVGLLTYLPPLLAAKARPFTVSGLIPLDPANLVVFFRSKSGITHSLDFPIDTDYDLPPALDVLMAACRPHASELDEYTSTRESLFYPPNLPLSATLEIANHPILEAVRNTLFSTLPKGHHITAIRDMLEIVPKGGRMTPLPKPIDSRIATIVVTLPVRYRGGALIIRDPNSDDEEIYRGGGKSHTSAQGHTGVGVDHLEWTAFLANCDYEVEEVTKGLRLTISYAVYVRSFGTGGVMPDPLITPSDRFLDLIAPILNICRGRKIAFYLTGEYGVNPAEMLAESLVPFLKGADSLLHHALKLYKLTPELRWTAGGYIWPVDRVVECSDDLSPTAASPPVPNPFDGPYRSPTMMHAGMLHTPMMGLSLGSPLTSPPMTIPMPVTDPGAEEDNLRWRVENSGAVPLAEEDILLMATPDPAGGPPLLGPVSKEKVPFVSGGKLDKLIVNVLVVAFVP